MKMYKKTELSHKLFEEVKKLKEHITISFIYLGELFKKIKKDKFWETNWSSFGAFLSDPEISISRRTADYLIKINEFFIDKLKLKAEDLQEIGWTKLREIIPYCSEKNYKDWLNEAKHLSYSDLKIRLREKEKGVFQENCEHKNIRQFWKCMDCFTKWNFNPKKK